jgi:phospholipase C
MVTTPTTAPMTAGREGVPSFAHIFVVVMENLGAQGAMAVPSVATLAARYESTTDWYAVAHPSLPNYLALVSGSTWEISSDCTSCYQSGTDLADQLDQAGISWGAYFGAMPSPCYLRPQSPDGGYAQKHDPFAYFVDLRDSPARCAHLQPLSFLQTQLGGPATGVPRFVWVTPDMCDSGHDCSPATAGAWLSGFVGQVTASAAWRAGGLLVVTWDEGDGDSGTDPSTGAVGQGGGGAVLSLVITPGAPPGRRVPGPYSHYSLLRTVEDALGVPYLGQAGAHGVRALGAFFAAAGGGS